jgi:hypothetical protein
MKDFTQKVTVKINIFFLHFILAFHTNAKKIKIAAKDLLILLYELVVKKKKTFDQIISAV